MTVDPGRSTRWWFAARTLRSRITAVATLIVFVTLAVAGMTLVAVERGRLTQNLRDTIEQRSDDLQALLAAGDDPGVVRGGGEDTLAQLVDAQGSVVAASPSLAGAPALVTGGSDVPRWRTLSRPVATSSDRFLVLARPIVTSSGPVTLNVASSLSDIDDASRLLAGTLAIGIPVLTAVLALVLWWLVGRTLRPVEAIRAEVAAIDGTDLHRRVRLPAGHDEVARLAATMNHMLDRVESTASRERRFVADASHELRTPLTRMRTELEVDLAQRSDVDLRPTCRSVLEETVHLQALVEDLLLLARASDDVTTRTSTPVDLGDVVRAEAKRQRRDHPNLVFDTTGVTDVTVLGDTSGLARVVANLASNAARYAAGTVNFTAVVDGPNAIMTVTDDGPGVPPGQDAFIFERFTRVDDARARDTGGSGLGLAIVRDIARRHRGTIVVDTSHHAGARFVFTMPRSPGVDG